MFNEDLSTWRVKLLDFDTDIVRDMAARNDGFPGLVIVAETLAEALEIAQDYYERKSDQGGSVTHLVRGVEHLHYVIMADD